MPVLTTDAESETGIPKSLSNEPPSETMEEIEHTCPQPRLVSKDKRMQMYAWLGHKRIPSAPAASEEKKDAEDFHVNETELPPNPSQLFIFSFSARRCSPLTKHYCTGGVGERAAWALLCFCAWEEGMAFFFPFKCALVLRLKKKKSHRAIDKMVFFPQSLGRVR